MAEPELSQKGAETCRKMGEEMRSLEIKLDHIICSGQKRAVLSARFLREGYNKQVPIKLNRECHGFRGVSKDG